MLSNIDYCSYLAYSPRGKSSTSRESRGVCDAVKGGRKPQIENIVSHIASNFPEFFEPFFDDGPVLVPAPSHAPMPPGGKLWPPLIISRVLLSHGLGSEVSACLDRDYAVAKSSTAGKGKRPTAQEHFDSMSVDRDLLNREKILVVDDVITQGATLVACVARLKEAFPDADVRAFSLLRAFGFDEVDNLLMPVASEVIFYPKSGKVFRKD